MKKIAYLLLYLATYCFATTCSDYNTLTGYGIIGSSGFTYGNNSSINTNVITGTNGTTPTPTGVVTTVHPTFPPFTPTTFPATGSTNITNQTTITPGSYGTIKIDQNNLLTAFSAGTYYIKELILSKNNTTAQLAPGDYYIEKLTMDNKSYITISPSGPVRIFIKTSFQGGNEVGINAGGNVENLILYLYSAVQMQIGNGDQGNQQSLTFNGIIYSPFANTSIEMGNNNNVQGAILSAGTVQVGNNTTFNYSTAVQTAVNGAFGCSEPPVLNTCAIEDFSQYSISFPFTNNWSIIKQQNYTPQVVNGSLMLTSLGGNIATGVTLNGSLPASNNYLEITFQSFAYGGTGADGITLTLSNAAVVPVAGAFGGSLGYAQKTGINGFAGGWLGFGLDEYGNFSNPTEGRSGGPGFRVDSVAVRGSGSGTTGYPYIAGTTTLTPGIDQSGTTPAPGHWYRMSIDTRNTGTLIKVERNTNNAGTGTYTPLIDWTNATQAAAAPTNYRLSLTGSTGGSNNYHITDNFTLKAINCGTITIVAPTPSNRFDAWDSFRSISDRNISTKIVGKPFNLTVASLNSSNNALQDFNGTVCATIVNHAGTAISGWNKLLFNAVPSVTSTFTLNRAIGGNDNAGVKLIWKKDVNEACPLINETNSTISSDRFAVRPASFAISAPNAVAGSDFNITFTAPNFSTTASTDYNETVGNSFDLSYFEHNTSCLQGSFTPAINSGWSFINGSKPLTTRYSEVGVVDINISDISKACNLKYANIDCDDADVTGFYNALTDLPIGIKQAQITVKPHHFDLNATLVNSGSGVFTYLSTDLNMSAKLDINVTAKNEQNVTTLNYDKGCYSKTTSLTLPHSVVPNPLTTILVHENLSNIDTNITKSNPISLSFNKTIFTQGSAPLNLLINFDRSRSAPLNPFDFNLSNATLTDSDGVIGTTIPKGTATYVYGRARAYDIKTDQSSAPNPIELEIYSSSSTGYVSGMPQNVLYWYRNLNHTNVAQGSILNGDDYSTTTNTGVSSTISINPSFYTPSNGLHSIVINNPDAISHATVHLNIPTWLWYSTVNNYDFTDGTKCTQHPCFDYQFFGSSTAGTIGVNSGTFQGSDFNLAPAKTNINKGVKVFR